MLSEINRICDTYSYVPIFTEFQGLSLIAHGTLSLGVSGILKVSEYYTGRKVGIPYISDDAGRFHEEIGIAAVKLGLKRIAPTTGTILVIYILSTKNKLE